MTMTDERLAELDAVMTRATEGPWQRKSGFEKLTIIGNIDGETVESQTKYTYEMVCEVYDDNGPIVAGRNVTAIVALHNAYPDLRAHIDAQAATIARVIGAAKSLLALCEQAGLADDLLATIYPDSKNRSGQTRDETAKQARRTMNEARAAIAEAAGAA